ncbi:MAG TPA: 2-C-methyl-D-erythritol 4-phosphate cytidylyltransferase [Baekduia sp.]|uniref:2-C-methyl-D-erythritol 4-phosphate cytidylyltransferase n=1 Tax=Baekduia sp. TaxID=2600305 RepID=UPI002D799523|nr:2-C-methyl-D-erythritol 4-phosphate cytidylyltransferase [Baekduia sp.]HET6508264.1 2-C-methyl-D-erythritol 4-phosphate cytidylyltransferase [Baekduia sp.]
MSAVALVVAAGRGERLGSSGPKAFVMCGGRPLLEWSIDALKAVPEISHIVVATPAGVEPPAGTSGVFGGQERSHSVRAALHHTLAGDPVLIHDAARPLVTPEIIRATLAGLDDEADGAIAAAPLADTLKREGDPVADGRPTVSETVARAGLWAIQTPQVFRRDILTRALDQPHDVLAAATDDASLVEGLGGTVRLVECPRENFKVTTPDDLRLADLLLRSR